MKLVTKRLSRGRQHHRRPQHRRRRSWYCMRRWYERRRPAALAALVQLGVKSPMSLALFLEVGRPSCGVGMLTMWRSIQPFAFKACVFQSNSYFVFYRHDGVHVASTSTTSCSLLM